MGPTPNAEHDKNHKISGTRTDTCLVGTNYRLFLFSVSLSWSESPQPLPVVTVSDHTCPLHVRGLVRTSAASRIIARVGWRFVIGEKFLMIVHWNFESAGFSEGHYMDGHVRLQLFLTTRPHALATRNLYLSFYFHNFSFIEIKKILKNIFQQHKLICNSI